MAVAMQGVLLWGKEAGANLTGQLFTFCKVDTNGNIVLCGSGDPAVGTLIEENTSGNQVTVQMSGIAKVKANATISAGTRVQSDGSGLAIALAAGAACGILLEAAVANQIVSVRLY